MKAACFMSVCSSAALTHPSYPCRQLAGLSFLFEDAGIARMLSWKQESESGQPSGKTQTR